MVNDNMCFVGANLYICLFVISTVVEKSLNL
jgi:hypothetical protein